MVPRVRIELTTFRLWDWRAAYCANGATTLKTFARGYLRLTGFCSSSSALPKHLHIVEDMFLYTLSAYSYSTLSSLSAYPACSSLMICNTACVQTESPQLLAYMKWVPCTLTQTLYTCHKTLKFSYLPLLIMFPTTHSAKLKRAKCSQ